MEEGLTVKNCPFEMLEHWICQTFSCNTQPSSCSRSCIA